MSKKLKKKHLDAIICASNDLLILLSDESKEDLEKININDDEKFRAIKNCIAEIGEAAVELPERNQKNNVDWRELVRWRKRTVHNIYELNMNEFSYFIKNFDFKKLKDVAENIKKKNSKLFCHHSEDN